MLNKFLDTPTHVIDSAWHFPLLTIEHHRVTVGNLTIAVVLLLFGLWYYKKLLHRIKAYLHHKIQGDKDTVNALETVISYAFIIIFITVVLQVANIPFSSFSFIGSALAIGVGLGAQNLINNFISSLIIMLERPLKIGDNIQIDGIKGVVIAIGARCITIQTSTLSEVLIPNSKLIQENLTNSTLNNNLLKNTIEIKFYKNSYCKIGRELGSALPADYHHFPAEQAQPHDPTQIIEQLREIIIQIPELHEYNKPKIFFACTDTWHYCYHIVFVINMDTINDLNLLRSKINIEIAKVFSLEDVIITYE